MDAVNRSLTDGAQIEIIGSGYSGLFALDATSFQIGQSSASRSLTFHSGTGMPERLRITGAGNVGIGTSSPVARLSVLTGTIGTIAQFRGADTDLLNIDGDSDVITLDARNVSALAFEMQGVEAMRINNAGNLGIGTTSPSASAILDAQSTTKGVRMPNMTTTQKNAIASPAAGLMVYDTTLAKLCVYTTAWETITSI
jgi:hypothetical protein